MKKNDYEVLIKEQGARLGAEKKQLERVARLKEAADNLKTRSRLAEEQEEEAESAARAREQAPVRPTPEEADVPTSSGGAPPGRAEP